MRVMTREEGIQGILHYQSTYDFTSLKRMGYPAHICPKAEGILLPQGVQYPHASPV